MCNLGFVHMHLPCVMYSQAILHLSHANDEIAVQALSFLHSILYHGNTRAQSKIGDQCDNNAIFFKRIQKLLSIVISNLGNPDIEKPIDTLSDLVS